jgi:hypothetical protein
MNYKPLLLPDEYEALPDQLRDFIETGMSPAERDLLLLSTIAAISGCLPANALIANKLHWANLFLVAIAPAGAGKGRISDVRDLISDYDRKRKEQEKFPFLIAGNSSAAAIYKALNDSGGSGVIIEQEVDTITQALNQDWGGFTDVLRKAFHHETISIMRKGEDALYFTVERPRLSIVLSGTPQQLTPLIASAENGLFSRMMFLYLPQNFEWHSLSPKNQKVDEKGLAKLKFKLVEAIQFCEDNSFTLSFSDEQWSELDTCYEELLKEDGPRYNGALSGTIKRMAVMIVKVCIVLSSLRRALTNDDKVTYDCNDEDFALAMQLSYSLLERSEVIMNTILKDAQPSTPLGNFLDKLPPSFLREDAVQVGAEIGLAERTVDKYLNRLVMQKRLMKPKNGFYQKASEANKTS